MTRNEYIDAAWSAHADDNHAVAFEYLHNAVGAMSDDLAKLEPKPVPDNEDAQEILQSFPMFRLMMRFAAMAAKYEQQDRELADARTGLPLEERHPEQERRQDAGVLRQRERELAEIALEVIGWNSSASPTNPEPKPHN